MKQTDREYRIGSALRSIREACVDLSGLKDTNGIVLWALANAARRYVAEELNRLRRESHD